MCENKAEKEISDVNLETGEVCMCILAAIALLQLFLLYERRKSCIASLPLLPEAVKLHMPLFLLSERSKGELQLYRCS